MKNALTVDVEDWYMTNDFNFHPDTWNRYEDRIVANTMALLELFDKRNVRGTFFILGCVAERHPQLIKEIRRANHEIGSHGGWHRMLTRMSLNEIREDLRYSKKVLESITSEPVEMFRAPSWSISPDRYEVFHILEEEGFSCDSSVQPFRTPLSGVAGAPHLPFRPVIDGKSVNVVEYPPTVLKIKGVPIPFSGGFYLRAMPYPFIRWALRKVNQERPGMIYVHPWEIDPGQPRLPASSFVKMTHYYGLRGTYKKLDRLLQEFPFATLGEVMTEVEFPQAHLQSAAGGHA